VNESFRVFVYLKKIDKYVTAHVYTYFHTQVNMTTETIIDLNDESVFKDNEHPEMGIAVPLWVGFQNPFSTVVVLTASDFNVYWPSDQVVTIFALNFYSFLCVYRYLRGIQRGYEKYAAK